MTRLRSLVLTLILSFITIIARAQGTTTFGETMRSNGRIYVVIGVLVIIFLGIIVYLIRLEKKMSKMENQFDHPTPNK